MERDGRPLCQPGAICHLLANSLGPLFCVLVHMLGLCDHVADFVRTHTLGQIYFVLIPAWAKREQVYDKRWKRIRTRFYFDNRLGDWTTVGPICVYAECCVCGFVAL